MPKTQTLSNTQHVRQCSFCGKKQFGKDVFDYGYISACEGCGSLVCNWCAGMSECCRQKERIDSYPKGRVFRITQ
jgi:hypothetical protein